MVIMADRRRLIADQPHKATANGGQILIAEPKIERLAVTFAYTQAGSGNASPSNVRPITGHSTIPVAVGSQTKSIALGGTYYGGTVDLVNGTLTETVHGIPGDSLETIRLDNYTATIVIAFFDIVTNGHPSYSSGLISNRFSTAISSGNVGRLARANNAVYFVMPRGDFTGTPDASAVKQWLVDHPTVFVYSPAQPITHQLTPQSVNALRGMQNVTSSAGSVEITYWTK